MTDTQFGIIVTIITALGGTIASAITWGIKRIVRAIDRNSDAMIENTKSNAILSTKIDEVARFVKMPARKKTGPVLVTPEEEGA